jgi:hypothetical protein
MDYSSGESEAPSLATTERLFVAIPGRVCAECDLVDQGSACSYDASSHQSPRAVGNPMNSPRGDLHRRVIDCIAHDLHPPAAKAASKASGNGGRHPLRRKPEPHWFWHLKNLRRLSKQGTNNFRHRRLAKRLACEQTVIEIISCG